MGKERNYVCMSKVATQYLIFRSFPYERILECFQDLDFRFDIQTEGLKSNYFKKQCYFLLTYSHLSNNRGGWNKRGGSAKVAK